MRKGPTSSVKNPYVSYEITIDWPPTSRNSPEGISHSLEVRVPLLEDPVVECALCAEDAARRRDHRPKALLRAALRDLLPAEIVEQRKRTFTLPWEEWLSGALDGRVTTVSAEWSPRLEAPLPAAPARSVWAEFLAGRTSWSRPSALYVMNG
jgi:asparagine synthase (glutamine-hydrolysing)